MKNPNPIVILCNSRASGDEYYKKHLANLNEKKRAFDDDWVDIYYVYTLDNAKLVLGTHSKTDFNGYILPEFKDNPEKIDILCLIQDAKKNISSVACEKYTKKVFGEHRKYIGLEGRDFDDYEEYMQTKDWTI